MRRRLGRTHPAWGPITLADPPRLSIADASQRRSHSHWVKEGPPSLTLGAPPPRRGVYPAVPIDFTSIDHSRRRRRRTLSTRPRADSAANGISSRDGR
jgi:hypothetical protein